jgi:hypothetical protein
MIQMANCIMDLQEGSDYLQQALFWIKRVLSLNSEVSEIKAFQSTVSRLFNLQTDGSTELDGETDIVLLEIHKKMAAPLFIEETTADRQTHTESAAVNSADERARLSVSQVLEEQTPGPAEPAVAIADNSSFEYSSSEGLEVPFSIQQPSAGNIKAQREHLRQLAQEYKKQKQQPSQSRPALKPEDQYLVHQIKGIKDIETPLTYEILDSLFQDPFFQGNVVLSKTKNGFMVAAQNPKTNAFKTASTHHQHPKAMKRHRKEFKHMDPAFIDEMAELLEVVFNL